MTRYQVFLPPKDLLQHSNEALITYQTTSFALPDGLSTDRQAAVACTQNDISALGSPFSSLNSLQPTRTTALIQDVTFNYAGAVDCGPRTQSESQSPKRSGRILSQSGEFTTSALLTTRIPRRASLYSRGSRNAGLIV